MVTAPDLLSLFSLDGMHAYVERHHGATAARIVGSLVVLGICAACVLVIWAVVGPIVAASSKRLSGQALPTMDRQGVVSLGVSLLVLCLVAMWFSRRIGRMNHEIGLVRSYLDENVHPRIQRIKGGLAHLQENAAGLDSVRQHDEWIEGRLDELERGTVTLKSIKAAVDELEQRIKTLEPLPLNLQATNTMILGELLGSLGASRKLRSPASEPKTPPLGS